MFPPVAGGMVRPCTYAAAAAPRVSITTSITSPLRTPSRLGLGRGRAASASASAAGRRLTCRHWRVSEKTTPRSTRGRIVIGGVEAGGGGIRRRGATTTTCTSSSSQSQSHPNPPPKTPGLPSPSMMDDNMFSIVLTPAQWRKLIILAVGPCPTTSRTVSSRLSSPQWPKSAAWLSGTSVHLRHVRSLRLRDRTSRVWRCSRSRGTWLHMMIFGMVLNAVFTGLFGLLEFYDDAKDRHDGGGGGGGVGCSGIFS